MADSIRYGTTTDQEGKDRYFERVADLPDAREFGPGLAIIKEGPALKISNGGSWSAIGGGSGVLKTIQGVLVESCSSLAGWTDAGGSGTHQILVGQGPNGEDVSRLTVTAAATAYYRRKTVSINGIADVNQFNAVIKSKNFSLGQWIRFPDKSTLQHFTHHYRNWISNSTPFPYWKRDAAALDRAKLDLINHVERTFIDSNEWYLFPISPFDIAQQGTMGSTFALDENGILYLSIGILGTSGTWGNTPAGAQVDFGPLYAGYQNDIATISFGFDDGFLTDLIHAAPYLAKYGYSGNQYTIQNRWGTAGYCTQAQVRKLQDEYGWLICMHSDQIIGGYDYSVDQIKAFMQIEIDRMNAAGFTAGIGHYAYVGGQFGLNGIQALNELGFKTARTGGPWYHPFNAKSLKNRLATPAANIETGTSDFADINAVKAFIDKVVATKSHCQLFHHDFAGKEGTSLVAWKAAVDYVRQYEIDGLVRVVTMDELYNMSIGS